MRSVFVVLGLLLACALLAAGFFGKDGALGILLGWIPFLVRIIPDVSPDRPTVTVGAGAFLVFAAGIHMWGYLWARKPLELEGSPRRRWRLRTTASLVAMIVVVFAAGTAMIGIVHQTGWLIRSDQPTYSPGISRYSYGNNLTQIYLGVMNATDRDGQLPQGGTYSAGGTGMHGWATQALPYMLYDTSKIDLKKPWNDPVNQKYVRCIIPEYINTNMRGAPLEDAEGYGLNHYAANVHVMGPNRGLSKADFKYGRSNTLLIGEVNSGFKPWGSPFNWRDPAQGIQGGPNGFGGPSGSRGVNFVMADGSIRFFRNSTNPAVIKALGTPARGEAVPIGD
jgi:hypothetical protein